MAKILVADDEPSIVQYCKYSLEKENHTVFTAENGSDTLDKLKTDKPDLLILDIMLPGIDGYTLQLQMSEDQILYRIPVVVISALQPAFSLFSKFAQVSGFLSKPFKPEELIAEVNKALNNERIKDLKYRPYM